MAKSHRTMTAAIAACVLTVVTSMGAHAADPSPISDVPAGMLDGNKLVLKECNAIVPAPSEDWKWLKVTYWKITAYSCSKGKTAYAVVPHFLFSFDVQKIKEIACGFMAKEILGYAARDPKIEPADKPLLNRTFRIEYSRPSLNGQTKVFSYMYVMKLDDKNALFVGVNSSDGTEPEAFTKFVQNIEMQK